jgi:hypothetical protein
MPNDLRLLSCTHPNDYRGQLLREPDRVKQNIQTRIAKSKPPKPVKETTTMPTHETLPVPPTAANSLTVTSQTMTKAMSVAPISAQGDFIIRMGKMIAASKMFGCNNDAQGCILAAACGGDMSRLVKIKQTYHIIGGNLTMRSDAMLAKFVSKPKNSFRSLSRTFDKAAIELKSGKEVHTFEITWAEAAIEDYVWTKEANADKKKRFVNGMINESMLKDNWSTPRRRMQMLWARVISDGVRAMDPTVNCGTYTADEMGGDAPEVSESDILDAEFTVTSSESIQDNAAADADVCPPASTSEKPAAPSNGPDAAASAEYTPPQSAASGAGGTATQLQADVTTPDADKLAMLKELKSLIDAGAISKEQYRKVLTEKGYASAKDMEIEKLAHLVHGLKIRLAKKKAAEGTDEVSQWANAATRSRQPETAGTPGN